MTMARDLQKDLDDVEGLINGGVKAGRYQDRYEEYRSLAELEQIRTRLRKQLGLDAGGSRDLLIEFNNGVRPNPAGSGNPGLDWHP